MRDDVYMLVFQKRLKETRKMRNLTQTDIGNAIFVSKQEVCLYESGKRTPPIDAIMKLANFLEVDFLWLIGMELNIPKAENRIVNLSQDDLNIIAALKKDRILYDKFLKDPDRAVSEITNKLNK